ncbi:MAG: prepilin-type N-terminal cleavage/methylation domain-containing protein [Alphaproteobacteria bacterium]|nr:prepilin-type N-terminal cleavage/methylation domain-containing protein [Alphaproteobacteria bacterium]
MGTRGRRDGGFTLIEVLVAFVILAISLSVLLQVFSLGLRSTHKSEGHLAAIQFAQSKLAAVGAELPLIPGRRSDNDPAGYRWQIDTRPVPEVEPQLGDAQSGELYQVTVTVRWGPPAGSDELTLTTLRLGPPLVRP